MSPLLNYLRNMCHGYVTVTEIICHCDSTATTRFVGGPILKKFSRLTTGMFLFKLYWKFYWAVWLRSFFSSRLEVQLTSTWLRLACLAHPSLLQPPRDREVVIIYFIFVFTKSQRFRISIFLGWRSNRGGGRLAEFQITRFRIYLIHRL